MRFGSYDTEDQVWIRDQTARILNRYVLYGKHFHIDVDALLSRARRLRDSVPACEGMRSTSPSPFDYEEQTCRRK